MRTGVDTVEAKCAVHVARLARLIQMELTSRNAFPPTDTVLGLRTTSHATESRTWISTGEMSDCTKLNWPIGQTYLQKDAPEKNPSITKAAAK